MGISEEVRVISEQVPKEDTTEILVKSATWSKNEHPGRCKRVVRSSDVGI